MVKNYAEFIIRHKALAILLSLMMVFGMGAAQCFDKVMNFRMQQGLAHGRELNADISGIRQLIQYPLERRRGHPF